MPNEAPIDLRSDTVTRPSHAMRAAMAAAPVGDDVIDVDPTISRLERTVAEMLGKEAAIYMPSGSMTNQIAIRLHCQPGDEFLCEEECHIYNYEQAAFAQLSGIVARTVKGDQGVLALEQLSDKIRPPADHLVRTRLVCLENTHNKAGGRILPYEGLVEICAWAQQQGLLRHLDGARLFNAVAATGIAVDDWAQHFDTVSVCFSKGLGAPVGSALVGPKDVIRAARRQRKLFGGGMRQAGIIAAGALYALENHVERLGEDHRKAERLGQAVQQSAGLRLAAPRIESNMVLFHVNRDYGTAADFLRMLADKSVLMLAMGSHAIRAVTHLDVSDEEVDRAGRILQEVAATFAAGKPVQV